MTMYWQEEEENGYNYSTTFFFIGWYLSIWERNFFYMGSYRKNSTNDTWQTCFCQSFYRQSSEILSSYRSGVVLMQFSENIKSILINWFPSFCLISSSIFSFQLSKVALPLLPDILLLALISVAALLLILLVVVLSILALKPNSSSSSTSSSSSSNDKVWLFVDGLMIKILLYWHRKR